MTSSPDRASSVFTTYVAVTVLAAAANAAAGLVLFFVGAVITHVHAGEYRSISYPGTFLLLAAGSLALRLAST
jgi:DoxX-like family